MNPRRARLALVAWLVVVIAGLALLTAAGRGSLAAPPASPGRWLSWIDDRDPATAFVALARLAALAIGWYLLAALVVGAAARLGRAHALIAMADRLTVPSARRILDGALGLAIVASSLTGVAGAETTPGALPAAAASAPEPVTMHRLPPTPVGAASSPAAADDAAAAMRQQSTPGNAQAAVMRAQPAPGAPATSPAPTMRRLPDAAEPHPAGPPSPAPPTPTPTTTTPSSSPAAAALVPGTWEVKPGEHFWSIAEHVLERAWGRAPTDRETDPYWRALVAANRAVLADGDNPDLLFPGQRLTIPPAPATPPIP
jgi:nucleoid-associated protein YgaU